MSELLQEIEGLRHDIERHIAISSVMADEIERKNAAIAILVEALEPFAAFMDGLEVLGGPSACRPGQDFYVLESSSVGRRAIGHDDFARARKIVRTMRGEE